jgi:hypothetical protein
MNEFLESHSWTEARAKLSFEQNYRGCRFSVALPKKKVFSLFFLVYFSRRPKIAR